MSERVKAFSLGLFVIVAFALVIWLVLFLRPSVGDGGKTLRIRFSNIEKVAVGTRVTFAGKPVGEVVAINEITNARNLPTDSHGNLYFYELVVRLDSSVHVYSYDEIIFSTAGLLGEKTIAIIPKQPPSGSPEAYELKDGVLYARSSDKLDETLTKLIEVADVFEQAMCEVVCFFKENSSEFHTALASFNGICSEVAECNLCPLFSETLCNLRNITGQISSGEGTLGHLLYDPGFYCQLEGAVTRLEQVMSDIHDFGLFFQFDRGWQRRKRMRMTACPHLSGNDALYHQFHEQVSALSTSLSQVGKAIAKMQKTRHDFVRDPRFEALIRQIEQMEKNMQETTHALSLMHQEIAERS